MAISINREPLFSPSGPTYTRGELQRSHRDNLASQAWYRDRAERIRAAVTPLPVKITLFDGTLEVVPNRKDMPEDPEVAKGHYNGNLSQLTLVLPQDPASIRSEG